MKQKRCSLNNTAGFTLIELLIAMVVFAIIVTAMYAVLINSNRNYAIQNEVVDAQNNLRAAVGLLSRDLRMAGFGITPPAVAFQTPLPTSLNEVNTLVFTTDEGTIEYDLSSKNLRRKPAGGSFQTIAENIQSVVFDFDLPKVTVTIIAETPNFDHREREASVTVQVRNM